MDTELDRNELMQNLERYAETYYTQNRGLSFTEAFCLLKKGYCVRRAEWLGYWEPVGGTTIIMHCKDGRQIDMSKGCLPMFTLEHTLAHDWLLVDEVHKAELDKLHASGVCGPAADQIKAAKILAENLSRRD